MEIPNNQDRLKVEHYHGLLCIARNTRTGVIAHHLPIPRAEKICQKFFYYDPRTRETKFVIHSEKGYEILKLGDQNWRPVEPDFRKGQQILMCKDTGKVLFFYPIQTPTQGTFDLEMSCYDLISEKYENFRNFPRNIFSDVTNITPFLWNNCPVIGEFTKDRGLRILVMKNVYCWSEKVIEISIDYSKFFNHEYLIPRGIIPVEILNSLLFFRYKYIYPGYEFSYDMKLGSVMGFKNLVE
ncbi:hypothetical protein G4B88_008172 [Cannabis sativa]|uniref:Uncharacterized protein n=1 Tax=Cannabis sativa TaxID=3483 RepID=A0A7J6I879_CANSA|nr:hypothetical protein G4B88_019349 [Cannabis sativa]KAF4403526.1 hypothetical protein G4B88_008172 [Cannabis sativa]